MAGKDYLKKIKAALLAGSMAVSLSACGDESEETKEVETTKVVEDVTTNTTTKETPTKETKTTSTQQETIKKEETTEKKTTEPTNEPTQNNTTGNSNNTNNNTTGNSNGNSNNNTVSTQNNTPSYEPTYEPEEPQYEEPYYKPEEPQYEEPEPITVPYKNRTYTKYDMTNDDSIAAVYAMRQLSDELAIDLFRGCESPKHRSLNGADETFAIIIALNYNQDLNLEMIGDYYYSDSNDEFNEELDILDLAKYQYDYNTNVDFNKYVLDADMANFINIISDEYREYMNGTSDSINEEVNSYFENNSNSIDDYVKYYFMCNTKKSLGWDDSQFETARQLYFDEVLNPLYNKFAQNRHRVKLH